MDVPVINMQGVEVGKLSIDAAKLGGEINPALIKQAYVMYHANQRVGTSRTKNRHAVSGSTKKIYNQKGTGRARHGDKKVPQFRGGGHAHHKQREHDDYRKDMPKKMRRKANLNALLAKLVDNEVRVVDSLKMSAPKTREFAAFPHRFSGGGHDFALRAPRRFRSLICQAADHFGRTGGGLPGGLLGLLQRRVSGRRSPSCRLRRLADRAVGHGLTGGVAFRPQHRWGLLRPTRACHYDHHGESQAL